MQKLTTEISLLDTLLGGRPGVTAAFLVDGPRPALVDTGARTSAPAVRAALAEAGLAPDDLAWIVLTHVHLDHCGATGILAAAFPRAQVVVHRRGARHLAEPARLVAASADAYGARWSLYGGLDRTERGRIVAADDGHRVALGGGASLLMVATPGHARHHMSVLHESSGTLLAGDALGVRFPGAGMYPALPPSEIDLDAGDASLRRLAALAPERLCVSHFGALADPVAGIALAREQLASVRAAASGPVEGLAERLESALPLEATVGDAGAVATWRRLGWAEANIRGVAGWRSSGLLS